MSRGRPPAGLWRGAVGRQDRRPRSLRLISVLQAKFSFYECSDSIVFAPLGVMRFHPAGLASKYLLFICSH